LAKSEIGLGQKYQTSELIGLAQSSGQGEQGLAPEQLNEGVITERD
jgi:hypothetical protein